MLPVIWKGTLSLTDGECHVLGLNEAMNEVYYSSAPSQRVQLTLLKIIINFIGHLHLCVHVGLNSEKKFFNMPLSQISHHRKAKLNEMLDCMNGTNYFYTFTLER